jgi:hypothetical protein
VKKNKNSSSLKIIGERRLPFFLKKDCPIMANYGILSRNFFGNTTKINLVTWSIRSYQTYNDCTMGHLS